MFRGLHFFTCPLLAMALLTSCGEQTKREFSEETGLRQRIDAFESEFEALADDFAYTAEPFDLPTPPAVPPSPVNSLTISTLELGSPMSNAPLTDDDHLSLNTDYGASRLLSSSFASEPMEEGWPEKVEAVLSKRYLVIYLASGYEPPRVVDGKAYYEGGTATLDVALYDREAKRYLLRFQVDGVAAGSVEAKAEEWKLKQNLVFEINNLLRQDLLKKMSAELEKQTGGVLYRALPEEATTAADASE